MTPEQVIQAAFAERSNRERDARLAQGFSARQVPLPPWAPEVATAALREAGMLNVGGSPGALPVGSEVEAKNEGARVNPEPHPSSCKGSCSPDPGVESGTAWEAGICGPARPLTPNEWAAFDHISDELKEMGELEKGMRNIADEGEWPEVAS